MPVLTFPLPNYTTDFDLMRYWSLQYNPWPRIDNKTPTVRESRIELRHSLTPTLTPHEQLQRKKMVHITKYRAHQDLQLLLKRLDDAMYEYI